VLRLIGEIILAAYVVICLCSGTWLILILVRDEIRKRNNARIARDIWTRPL
jgi:hypothetical protein